jgi:hypothetical protein
MWIGTADPGGLSLRALQSYCARGDNLRAIRDFAMRIGLFMLCPCAIRRFLIRSYSPRNSLDMTIKAVWEGEIR